MSEPKFGADFSPLPEAESYYPTRLEYFAGKALQGLLVGKNTKDHRNAVKLSVKLARELEDEIDSTQS